VKSSSPTPAASTMAPLLKVTCPTRTPVVRKSHAPTKEQPRRSVDPSKDPSGCFDEALAALTPSALSNLDLKSKTYVAYGRSVCVPGVSREICEEVFRVVRLQGMETVNFYQKGVVASYGTKEQVCNIVVFFFFNEYNNI
jgi:hypothetical protein